MADSGIKSISQLVGEQGKQTGKQSGAQNQQNLSQLLDNLMAQTDLNQAGEAGGIEGTGGSKTVGQKSQTNKPSSDGQATSQEAMAKKQKEAELQARLQEIIARYKRIQDEIRVYQKRQEKEKRQKEQLEEEEKKKKMANKKKKQEAVALPSSPKKGFMAGFLKKLSSGGEQGRLKE